MGSAINNGKHSNDFKIKVKLPLNLTTNKSMNENHRFRYALFDLL